MRRPSTPSLGAWAWPAILAAATVVGSLAAACLMPLVALAAIASATLGLRGAAFAVLAAWAFSQAAGFAFLGWPRAAQTVAQGASLALAALLALFVARAVGAGSLLRLAAGFAAGFLAYEALLFAAAHVTGGLWTFAPTYVAQIAVSEAIWFGLLTALALTLQRVAPALAPPRPIGLRLA